MAIFIVNLQSSKVTIWISSTEISLKIHNFQEFTENVIFHLKFTIPIKLKDFSNFQPKRFQPKLNQDNNKNTQKLQ